MSAFDSDPARPAPGPGTDGTSNTQPDRAYEYARYGCSSTADFHTSTICTTGCADANAGRGTGSRAGTTSIPRTRTAGADACANPRCRLDSRADDVGTGLRRDAIAYGESDDFGTHSSNSSPVVATWRDCIADVTADRSPFVTAGCHARSNGGANRRADVTSGCHFRSHAASNSVRNHIGPDSSGYADWYHIRSDRPGDHVCSDSRHWRSVSSGNTIFGHLHVGSRSST